MNTHCAGSSNRNLIILALFSAVIVCGAAWLAAYDDRSLRLSLVAFKPLVDGLLPWGRLIEDRADILLQYAQLALLGCAVLVAASTLVWRTRETCERVAFVLAGLLAMHAQISLGLRQNTAGIYCYAASFALILAYFLLRKTSFDPAPPTRQRVTGWEVGAFLAIFAVAVFLRFYGLNYLFDYFEGEESPFSGAGTDLKASALANMGDNGPWSPFGLIYYAIRYPLIKLFGTTLLAMRFGSAMSAMAILALTYFFVRDIAGRGAALAAIAVLAIDAKQISWARYEFPHVVTAFTAVAIAWLTYRTFSMRSLIYPALLSIFMGLCFHQYPSGQTAVAIPWLYLAYLLVFNREQTWRFYGIRLAFLIIGSALWYYGFSIAYFLAYERWAAPSLTGRFDSRVAWKTPEASQSIFALASVMLDLLLRNAHELFGSMVYSLQVSMPPQDMVPSFSHVTSRTIFLLAPAFVLLAGAYFLRNMKWKQGALLLVWAVAASAPCLLSNQGYPRRAATIFTAFICMAGIGYWLCRRMLSDIWGKPWRIIAPCIEIPVVSCLVLASTQQWLSTRTMRIAEPGEMEVYRTIKQMLHPGTLMFFEYDDHYMPGRMTYLLLDDLDRPENRPITWAVVNAIHPVFKPSTENPRNAPKLVKQSLEYRWSKLRHHIPEIESYNGWKKLIFISERMPSAKDAAGFDQRMEMITSHCVNHKETLLPQKVAFYHFFKIVECDLPAEGPPEVAAQGTP